jgi:hypothetical protein
MRGFEKKIFDPSYVPMRFFEAMPGRAREIKKIFFASFLFFTSKLNYCRVTGPQNKIFIKNQLTLVYSTVRVYRVYRVYQQLKTKNTLNRKNTGTLKSEYAPIFTIFKAKVAKNCRTQNCYSLKYSKQFL